jgi:copper chaperone CopZ
VSERLSYSVPAVHCDHCRRAITEEVAAVPGVETVVVDLETKQVDVNGEELDDDAIRAAIEEAGYEPEAMVT